MPGEVTIEDKSMVERFKLIDQLDEEDSIIDKMLPKRSSKTSSIIKEAKPI